VKLSIANPLLIAMLLIIAILVIFHIPFEAYNQGGAIISMFILPATACLGVSIYQQIDVLKKHWLPIIIGCTAGSLASIASVFGLCKFFGLDDVVTHALLPKSVTMPIAVSIVQNSDGILPITIIAVIFTGILGNLLAPFLIKVFRINDPMTAGVAIGASSHVVGTAKAIEIGETEGSMSGLAIGLCGVITVLLSLVFYSL
jgi:putative effector of murein hydrolase